MAASGREHGFRASPADGVSADGDADARPEGVSIAVAFRAGQASGSSRAISAYRAESFTGTREQGVRRSREGPRPGWGVERYKWRVQSCELFGGIPPATAEMTVCGGSDEATKGTGWRFARPTGMAGEGAGPTLRWCRRPRRHFVGHMNGKGGAAPMRKGEAPPLVAPFREKLRHDYSGLATRSADPPSLQGRGWGRVPRCCGADAFGGAGEMSRTVRGEEGRRGRRPCTTVVPTPASAYRGPIARDWLVLAVAGSHATLKTRGVYEGETVPAEPVPFA